MAPERKEARGIRDGQLCEALAGSALATCLVGGGASAGHSRQHETYLTGCLCGPTRQVRQSIPLGLAPFPTRRRKRLGERAVALEDRRRSWLDPTPTSPACSRRVKPCKAQRPSDPSPAANSIYGDIGL